MKRQRIKLPGARATSSSLSSSPGRGGRRVHVAGHGGGHTPGCSDPFGRTHFPLGCRESLLHKGPVRGDGTSPYPSTTARGDPQTGNYRPQPVISTEQSGPNAHTAAGLAPPPWAPTLTSSPSEHRGALPRPSQSQRRRGRGGPLLRTPCL